MSTEQPENVTAGPRSTRHHARRGTITRAAAVVLTLGAVVALPASVQAVRPATDAEFLSVMDHLDGPVWMGCYAVSISTADGQWATTAPAEPITEACAEIPRETRLHRKVSGRWDVVATVEEPSARCSEMEDDLDGIETDAGVDLGVCTAWPPVPRSRTTLSCWKNDKDIRNVRRPRSCVLPATTISGSYILTNIRWRNWGGRVATATALQQANHGRNVNGRIVFDKRRVKLRASRPVESEGKRWYQRVTVNGRKASGVTDPWADSPFE